MSNKIYRKIVEGKIFRTINNKLYKGMLRILKGLNKRLNTGLKYLDGAASYFPRKSLSNRIKVRDNTIMLLTYQGDYTCNPRAVADEILRQNLDWELIWVVKKDTDRSAFPKKIKLVERGSYSFYEAAASAKIFIDNTHDLHRLGVHKKKDQYFLQTWHGSLGIKRLDGEVVMGRKWNKLAAMCRAETDYCISNSSFEDEVFDTSYWKGVPTLNYGHARNDILFTRNPEKLAAIRQKVCSELGVPQDRKILLYAPTHKDDVNESFSGLDYEGLKEALEQRFGGSWIIALRFHSRLRKKYTKWLKNLPPYVADATGYGDIQELMLVTDVGLTDYSSWVFDYILLHRPGFILAEDAETFEKNRSFYYPLESTPFPIARTSQELTENIKAFDEDQYAADVENFLKERGCIEDGHASERVVEKIKELIVR